MKTNDDEIAGSGLRLFGSLTVCVTILTFSMLYSIFGNNDGSFGIGVGERASLLRRFSLGFLGVTAAIDAGYLSLRSYHGHGYTFPDRFKWLGHCSALLIVTFFVLVVFIHFTDS